MRVDAASPRPAPIVRPRRPAHLSRRRQVGPTRPEGPDQSGPVLRRRGPLALRGSEPEKLADLLTPEEKRFIQRLFPSRSAGSAKPYDAVEGYAPRLGGMIDLRG